MRNLEKDEIEMAKKRARMLAVGFRIFSEKTICHTGFTGTGIVIDPELDCSVILLTNSVHPDEGGSTVRLRSVVSNTVAASITDR